MEINSFNGMAMRILYSPLSKILSIHSFSLNPYSLSDRKYYNELCIYLEA